MTVDYVEILQLVQYEESFRSLLEDVSRLFQYNQAWNIKSIIINEGQRGRWNLMQTRAVQYLLWKEWKIS